jgi:hypothetical protein
MDRLILSDNVNCIGLMIVSNYDFLNTDKSSVSINQKITWLDE